SAKGFYTLAELMTEAAVRAEVLSCHTQLVRTVQTLKALRTYKLIHDKLQEVQFDCYEPIVGESYLPWDHRTMTSLERYRAKLSDSISWFEGNVDQSWSEQRWVNRLRRANELLEESIRQSDAAARNEAVENLRAVCDFQPSVVNTRLKTLAGTLDLKA